MNASSKSRRSARSDLGRGVLAAVLATAALAIPYASRGSPVEVVGQARVINGQSLLVQGEYVRLANIQAPNLLESCRTGDSGARTIGEQAAARLAELIADQEVRCTRQVAYFDSAGATCRVGGLDLGARLVSEGYARSRASSLSNYYRRERLARDAGRGIWKGECMAPA